MWITSKSVGTLLALVVFEYCMASATRGGYLKFEVMTVKSYNVLSILISFSFTTSPLDKNSGNYCLGSLTIKIGISKAVES